eukprot:5181894-Prymnesium_polylepis.2
MGGSCVGKTHVIVTHPTAAFSCCSRSKCVSTFHPVSRVVACCTLQVARRVGGGLRGPAGASGGGSATTLLLQLYNRMSKLSTYCWCDWLITSRDRGSRSARSAGHPRPSVSLCSGNTLKALVVGFYVLAAHHAQPT